MRRTGHVPLSVANAVVTPPPPDTRIQQDDSNLLPSTNVVDYELEELRAMKDHESVRRFTGGSYRGRRTGGSAVLEVVEWTKHLLSQGRSSQFYHYVSNEWVIVQYDAVC
jgi:hypothetical protein